VQSATATQLDSVVSLLVGQGVFGMHPQPPIQKHTLLLATHCPAFKLVQSSVARHAFSGAAHAQPGVCVHAASDADSAEHADADAAAHV
jgi:hypothetical protein